MALHLRRFKSMAIWLLVFDHSSHPIDIFYKTIFILQEIASDKMFPLQ